MAAPVALDEELELRIDSLAYGGNGVARLDGFVVFVRRGLPGDLVRARVTKVKRNHAEALAVDVLEPGRGARRRAVRALPRLRRLPFPGSRLRGSGRGEGGPGSRRAAAHRRARRRRRSSRSVPAESPFHYRNKLEYSFTQTPDGPALGFHRAGRWDEVLDDRDVLADDRPRQRDPRRRPGLGARGAARAYDQTDARGLPPPSRRPRGPQHRPGARRARDRARRAARRGVTSSTSCAASPRCARSTGRSTTARPR